MNIRFLNVYIYSPIHIQNIYVYTYIENLIPKNLFIAIIRYVFLQKRLKPTITNIEYRTLRLHINNIYIQKS